MREIPLSHTEKFDTRLVVVVIIVVLLPPPPLVCVFNDNVIQSLVYIPAYILLLYCYLSSPEVELKGIHEIERNSHAVTSYL